MQCPTRDICRIDASLKTPLKLYAIPYKAEYAAIKQPCMLARTIVPEVRSDVVADHGNRKIKLTSRANAESCLVSIKSCPFGPPKYASRIICIVLRIPVALF